MRTHEGPKTQDGSFYGSPLELSAKTYAALNLFTLLQAEPKVYGAGEGPPEPSLTIPKKRE